MFLDHFDVNNFDNYYSENNDKNFFDVAIDFLDIHLKLASKRVDFKAFFDVYSSKVLCYVLKEDFKSDLNGELKLFITRLNPICGNDELAFHEALNLVIVSNLKVLMDLCNIRISKKDFNGIWDEMNLTNVRISRKNSFDYYTKALKTLQFNELSGDIGEGYHF